MCKKNCLSCQFFCVYGDHQFQGRMERTVRKNEREEIQNNVSNSPFYEICHLRDIEYYLCCYRCVWNENKSIKSINRTASSEQDLNDKERAELKNRLLKAIVDDDRSAKNSRGNSCFYFKFQEGMSLGSAEELEKRETGLKDAAADRKWIKWGVRATFATAAIALISLIGWFWK